MKSPSTNEPRNRAPDLKHDCSTLGASWKSFAYSFGKLGTVTPIKMYQNVTNSLGIVVVDVLEDGHTKEVGMLESPSIMNVKEPDPNKNEIDV